MPEGIKVNGKNNSEKKKEGPCLAEKEVYRRSKQLGGRWRLLKGKGGKFGGQGRGSCRTSDLARPKGGGHSLSVLIFPRLALTQGKEQIRKGTLPA